MSYFSKTRYDLGEILSKRLFELERLRQYLTPYQFCINYIIV